MYEPMRAMWEEAKDTDKWFYSPYHRLWFSPDELLAEWGTNHFRWGPKNWRLRNPNELLIKLLEDHMKTTQSIVDFKNRLANAT